MKQREYVIYESYEDNGSPLRLTREEVSKMIGKIIGRRVKPSTFNNATSIGQCVQFAVNPQGRLLRTYPDGYVILAKDQSKGDAWVRLINGSLLISDQEIDHQRPREDYWYSLHDAMSGAMASEMANLKQAYQGESKCSI